MRHDELIGQVRHRTRLASRNDAEHATRAALQTLGEAVQDSVMLKVAGSLPDDIAELVTASGAG